MNVDPDATLFAAFHGEGRVPRARVDAYSLFVARSSAMGWLTPAVQGATGGLWGMNDAGTKGDVTWFQAALTTPVPSDRPLPMQPFVSCAGEATVRLRGRLDFTGLLLLVPAQSLTPSLDAVAALLQDAEWFTNGSRQPVRVTVDSGQEPSIPSAAGEMLGWMRDFEQPAFSPDSLDDNPVVLEPVPTDHLWAGPPRHRATFNGTLAEWSPSALGWLAAFLAQAATQHQITTPLLLTIAAGQPGD